MTLNTPENTSIKKSINQFGFCNVKASVYRKADAFHFFIG